MSDQDAKHQTLLLDFDRLRERNSIWIRRASIFMGIGANAARVNPPLSHVLDDRMQYHFTKQEVTEDEARHYVEEFETWVVASGLRELIEGHSTFLDNAYGPSVLINRGVMTRGDLAKLVVAFEGENVFKKRAAICAELGIDDQFAAMCSSLNKARNCLAHRNGVVGQRDVNTDDGCLEITWRFLGVRLGEGGPSLDLNRDPREVRVEQETTIQVGPQVRTSRFALRTQLRLTRHDLSEICLGFSVAADNIIAAMQQLSATKGVEVVPAKAPEAGN